MTTRANSRTAGPEARPTLHIGGPADLLQAVPYLLGFHPRDSLVLLGLSRTALVVTARLDLADVAESGLLGQVVTAFVDGGATKLIAAVYDSEPAALAPAGLPWRGIAPALADECDRAGCELGQVLRVAAGRWWSYLGDAEWRCPPEGIALPVGPSRFAAEATYAGMVALPDREALVATLAPLPAADRARLLPLLEQEERAAQETGADGAQQTWECDVGQEIAALARTFDRTGSAPPLEDCDVARLGVALGVVRVRDALWLAVERHQVDGRELWRELARRLPGRYAAAPLFLFGWASWRAGNGALAGVAVERVLTARPHYGAAEILQTILASGLDPRRFPELTAGEARRAGSVGQRRLTAARRVGAPASAARWPR